MRPDQLERRLRERLDALGPAPRADLLHVLMLPDFEQADGISRSEVSRICKVLDEEVRTFLGRSIEQPCPYLWLDATFHKLREPGVPFSARFGLGDHVCDEFLRVLYVDTVVEAHRDTGHITP